MRYRERYDRAVIMPQVTWLCPCGWVMVACNLHLATRKKSDMQIGMHTYTC